MKSLLILFALSWLGLFGDYILKKAGLVNPTNYRLCWLGMLIYASTAFGWFYVLREMKMVRLAVMYPLFQAIGMAFVGVLVFGEVLSRREMLGFGLGLIALWLVGSK